MKEKGRALSRFAAVVIALTALLAWGLVLNVNTGPVDIPAGDVFRLAGEGLRQWLRNLFSGGAYRQELDALLGATAESRIIFSIRMPRMLLAAVLGGGLSVSAGPFVLGISSGAKMIVGVVTIFLSLYLPKVNSAAMVLSSFAGSLLVALLVLAFSQRVRGMSMLLVIGIMVSYICSAVTDFCIAFAKEQDIVNLTTWGMGTFSGASWEDVGVSVLICGAGFLAAWSLSKPIGAFALGEGYARSLGINVKLFRALLIILSSLLSACVTAFAGPISFVGIAVPHIVRSLLKTSRPALVIPASCLCGAVFCVFCDLIARTAFSPTELAIGTVTSAFGAPVVIAMMLKRRREQEG